MKVSSVLVRLDAPLRFLPPDVQHALSSVLFHWFKGMDREHASRWKRMWQRLYHSREQQPSLQLWIDVERSRPFHARWMAIEERLFDAQDCFYAKAAFRKWLKTGAAFGQYEASAGTLVFVPSSLNWEDCSDDEMREFTEDALTYLRTPRALATLWPVVPEHERDQMLETCLIDPTKETTQ